jgi:hypothetical protein
MRDCVKIRHYLNHLSPTQEDRVLCNTLGRAPNHIRNDGCRCLCGTAEDYQFVGEYALATDPLPMRESWPAWMEGVGGHFDTLCERFGEERINAAIRNRILTNQARRTLRSATQLNVVTVG